MAATKEHDMTRHPMTADQARCNVAEMISKTPASARKRLLQIALGPLGNLSDEARAVYQAALAANA
jgi:hypothetical protein